MSRSVVYWNQRLVRRNRCGCWYRGRWARSRQRWRCGSYVSSGMSDVWYRQRRYQPLLPRMRKKRRSDQEQERQRASSGTQYFCLQDGPCATARHRWRSATRLAEMLVEITAELRRAPGRTANFYFGISAVGRCAPVCSQRQSRSASQPSAHDRTSADARSTHERPAVAGSTSHTTLNARPPGLPSIKNSSVHT